MPIVRVVTPTDPQTDTIKAFQAELVAKVAGSIDYRVYSAADDNDNLDDVVKYAVSDSPAAILACGSMAAKKLQDQTTSIPIVQVGGLRPANAQSNLTGFTINTIGGKVVSQHHLDKLAAARQKITVLYDDSNEPSHAIFTNLQDPQKKVSPLNIGDPADFATYTVATDGFMLIPNAMYFKHRKHIVAMLDNDNVKAVYFPEREYKMESSAATQGKARIHGHDLPATFRAAADIVAAILSHPKKSLPSLKEGIKDTDD